MTMLGMLITFLACAAIVLMIVASIYAVMKDSEDERVDRLANKRIREILSGAQIVVTQHVQIVDETK